MLHVKICRQQAMCAVHACLLTSCRGAALLPIHLPIHLRGVLLLLLLLLLVRPDHAVQDDVPACNIAVNVHCLLKSCRGAALLPIHLPLRRRGVLVLLLA